MYGDVVLICLLLMVFSGEILCCLVLEGVGIVCLFDFMIVVDCSVGVLV